MQPSLCKKHLRQVSNVFDKETAFGYVLDAKTCVICQKVIFIEGARRYLHTQELTLSDPSLRLPDAVVHSAP